MVNIKKFVASLTVFMLIAGTFSGVKAEASEFPELIHGETLSAEEYQQAVIDGRFDIPENYRDGYVWEITENGSYTDELICGQGSHTHSSAEDGCQETVLTCTEEAHEHDDSCYVQAETYKCGKKEHKHTIENCYKLTCRKLHKHDKHCYELTCKIQEHTHDKKCFNYVCGQEEHKHEPKCYKMIAPGKSILVCYKAEHTHTDACVATGKTLTCTNNEHQHNGSCYTAKTCDLDEHQHTEACYKYEIQSYTCSLYRTQDCKTYKNTVTITIKDDNGNPVSNATVFVHIGDEPAETEYETFTWTGSGYGWVTVSTDVVADFRDAELTTDENGMAGLELDADITLNEQNVQEGERITKITVKADHYEDYSEVVEPEVNNGNINIVINRKTYKVKFMADCTVVSEQAVKFGDAAKAPSENEIAIPGNQCAFDKWDKEFSCIAEDTDINAIFMNHKAGEPVKENEIAATTEHTGSYDTVTYCDNCRKELSRETTEIAKLTPVVTPVPSSETQLPIIIVVRPTPTPEAEKETEIIPTESEELTIIDDTEEDVIPEEEGSIVDISDYIDDTHEGTVEIIDFEDTDTPQGAALPQTGTLATGIFYTLGAVFSMIGSCAVRKSKKENS